MRSLLGSQPRAVQGNDIDDWLLVGVDDLDGLQRLLHPLRPAGDLYLQLRLRTELPLFADIGVRPLQRPPAAGHPTVRQAAVLTLPTAGGFSAQPPSPAPARSYTVSPSVSVRACPALPYVLSTPTDADLPSRYSLRRSCLGRGLCRIPGKSTPARQGLLFRSTEHRIQNKAGWMGRSGLP